MDWGCKFYTPHIISEYVTTKIKDAELIVDLFSGSGCLYRPILSKSKNNISILALDIDPNVYSSHGSSDSVSFKKADCLDPKNIKEALIKYSNTKATVILNPPFHSVKSKEELSYWNNISKIKPQILLHRIECIALASTLKAVPVGTEIFAIIPITLIQSEAKAFFFNTLKNNYSLITLKTFRRERFGGAEVDVAIIKLTKNHDDDLCAHLNEHANNKRKNMVRRYSFEIFRGQVRSPHNRHLQTSAKHLKVGGIEIDGSHQEAPIDDCRKISQRNDILIARVGVRTLGRVAQVVKGKAYTNESILNLRIKNKNERDKVYNALKSKKFINWIKKEARGTSNYFIPTNKLKKWINSELNK